MKIDGTISKARNKSNPRQDGAAVKNRLVRNTPE